MSNLILSLNISVPVFLLILFGYLLKRKGIVNEEYIGITTTLVYYFALPARLFRDVSSSDFYSLINGKFILFTVGITVFSFILVWGLAAVFIKEKRKISAFVHGVFRSNYVYVGLPLTQNILGTDVIPSTILIITFVIPMYNILAVILLTYYDSKRGKISIKKMIVDILKNPMIIAILVALPCSILKVSLPFAITKSLDYIGSIATPLALILIGAGMRFNSFIDNKKYILCASVLKVIIQPLLFIPMAMVLGFNREEIYTIFVMLAVPTAMNSYIMTKQLGGDGELSAGIIVSSVIFSFFTIPIGVSILRMLI
ncbi:MAG: AEC family transporter [Clostridiales bacterium]|nr:AEC family transporter [Clostridiales bacterium]